MEKDIYIEVLITKRTKKAYLHENVHNSIMGDRLVRVEFTEKSKVMGGRTNWVTMGKNLFSSMPAEQSGMWQIRAEYCRVECVAHSDGHRPQHSAQNAYTGEQQIEVRIAVQAVPLNNGLLASWPIKMATHGWLGRRQTCVSSELLMCL